MCGTRRCPLELRERLGPASGRPEEEEEEEEKATSTSSSAPCGEPRSTRCPVSRRGGRSELLPRPESLTPNPNLPQTLALTLKHVSCGIVGCQQRSSLRFVAGEWRVSPRYCCHQSVCLEDSNFVSGGVRKQRQLMRSSLSVCACVSMAIRHIHSIRERESCVHYALRMGLCVLALSLSPSLSHWRCVIARKDSDSLQPLAYVSKPLNNTIFYFIFNCLFIEVKTNNCILHTREKRVRSAQQHRVR